MQDDWKASARLTSTWACATSSTFPTRRRRPAAELRPCRTGARLRRRKRRPPGPTSRRGGATSPLAWEPPGTSPATERTCCAPGTAGASFPCPTRRGTCIHLNVPLHDLPELQHWRRTPSTSRRPACLGSRTPSRRRARQAHDHGRAERRQPAASFGHGVLQRDARTCRRWQVSYERQITNSLMAEVAYAGSKGIEPHLGRQPERGPAGPGTQASRRLIQPLSNVVDTSPASTPPTARASQPAGQGGQALCGRAAVPVQLHLRQVPRLRRRARVGRRRRGRPAERHALRAEPRAVWIRRQAPLRAELRVGPPLRRRPPRWRAAASASRSSETGCSAGS